MSDQEKRIQEIASIFRHCARIASGCSHAYIAPETLIEAADLIDQLQRERPDPYNPDRNEGADHIVDANKKADHFREPTKMMQNDM